MFMAAIPIEGDVVVWGRLHKRVWPVRQRELWTVQLRARSSRFLWSCCMLDLMKMTSWKYWSLFCWAATWTWNVTWSSSTWGFECFVSTMVNSLRAVVSYCMHCKVCMHQNHGVYALPPLITCPAAYLHNNMLHSHSVCHFHTQPISYCKTIMQDYVTQLCQSSVLKTVLFPGSHSAFCWYSQWWKEGCHSTCVYTPYSSTSKATT